MTTVREAIVNFVVQEPDITKTPTQLRNLAYLCSPLSSVTEEYVLVTSADDVALYTDDVRIKVAFTQGLNQVYLVFSGNITDFTIINSFAYTLLISPDVNIVPNTASETFDGIIMITQNEPTSLTLPTDTNIPEQIVSTFKIGGFYAPVAENLGVRVLANMISPELNADWKSLQLKTYEGTTASVDNGDDVIRMREKQFSGTAQDIDVTLPTLVYLRAGGHNLADYYIVENLRQDIQSAMINYLANLEPRYLNSSIGNMMVKGNAIISDYVARGLIESGEYLLPPKQSQSSTDIINGMVNNATLTITIGGAIWSIKGTVTTVLGV